MTSKMVTNFGAGAGSKAGAKAGPKKPDAIDELLRKMK
jgi:hypothetical protein